MHEADERTALQPFFATSSRKYWTANKLRSTAALGYTYPELANGASTSAVKAAINKLYGSSGASNGLSRRSIMPDTDNRDSTDTPDEVPDNKYRQYTANILCQKFALNSSFAIYVFLGAFDDTPATWATSPNLVGTHAVFTGMTGAVGTVRGVKVQTQQKPRIPVTGTMPLTSTLLQKVETGELGDMAPEAIEAYLQANLQWRVSLVSISPPDLQRAPRVANRVATCSSTARPSRPPTWRTSPSRS